MLTWICKAAGYYILLMFFYVFFKHCTLDLGVHLLELLMILWAIFLSGKEWVRNCLEMFFNQPKISVQKHCFPKIIARNFPSWQCIKSYLNAVNQHNSTTVGNLLMITFEVLSLVEAVHISFCLVKMFFSSFLFLFLLNNIIFTTLKKKTFSFSI